MDFLLEVLDIGLGVYLGRMLLRVLPEPPVPIPKRSNAHRIRWAGRELVCSLAVYQWLGHPSKYRLLLTDPDTNWGISEDYVDFPDTRELEELLGQA